MSRFVVFSDLHLHPWQYGSRIIDGRNSRLWNQVEQVRGIVNYCEQHEITKAFFSGDLFHTTTVSAETSTAAYLAFKMFRDRGIVLYMNVGNHDQADKAGKLHNIHMLKGLCEVMEPAWPYIIGDMHWVSLDYTDSREHLEAGLKILHETGAEGSMVLMHQGVSGVEINSKGFTLNEILRPEDIPSSIAAAFTGHYHSHKQVTRNLIIPGSLMQLNWGDKGEERGFLDCTWNNGQVTFKRIPTTAPTFHEYQSDQIHDRTFNNEYVRVFAGMNEKIDEIVNHVMGAGAFSVEVKQERPETKFERIQSTRLQSFEELTYAYATSKERAGTITYHEKDIGDRLLKQTYQLP